MQRIGSFSWGETQGHERALCASEATGAALPRIGGLGSRVQVLRQGSEAGFET